MFTSFTFILFLTILWLIYLCVPKKFREVVLLLAGYLFIGYLSLTALAAVIISTLVVYASGITIDNCKRKGKTAGKVAACGISLFAFVLVVVKNIPTVINLFGGMGFPEDGILRNIILPIGFSFYAFQAIGYIYDVYKGTESAERDVLKLALYMGFFAKFVSGPIERKEKFCKQIDNLSSIKIIDKNRIKLALVYMLWGYFLKLVVADRLALTVDVIHLNPGAYDSLWLVICAVFYSFQIYTDFAGYTYIAIGAAKLFGIDLIQNFESPYLSKNITEFWRRWHISLSSWLKDYVYIPLGGNRKGILRKYINTMIVFILCGIWHGNGAQFLVWGILHGIYSALDGYTLKKCPSHILARILTFLAVSFAWIFFRAETLTAAVKYIGHMFAGGIHPMSHMPYFVSQGGVLIQLLLGAAFIVLVWITDAISYKKTINVPEMINDTKLVYKCLIVYILIMIIFVFGIYGVGFDADKFIYMQF